MDILEVGSGPEGIGKFLPRQFVGCDVHFNPSLLSKYLLPVCGSVMTLPFGDDVFDAVICLDMVEHIGSGDRPSAIRELVRVARHHVILGFPCGEKAEQVDGLLYRWYVRMGHELPEWLTEHFAWDLPRLREVEEVLATLDVSYEVVGNENLFFHLLVMILESMVATRFALHLSIERAMGAWLKILRLCNSEPVYRRVFFVTKRLHLGLLS